VERHPPAFLADYVNIGGKRESLILDSVLASFFIALNWSYYTYDDHTLADHDLTAKLSLLSFLPRPPRCKESKARYDEITSASNYSILAVKPPKASKLATSLSPTYLCDKRAHVGTAIYSLLTMIVAVTREPKHPPLPLQPHSF
jgi:hypothetical protein